MTEITLHRVHIGATLPTVANPTVRGGLGSLTTH
jgi:hypothetical protein